MMIAITCLQHWVFTAKKEIMFLHSLHSILSLHFKHFFFIPLFSCSALHSLNECDITMSSLIRTKCRSVLSYIFVKLWEDLGEMRLESYELSLHLITVTDWLYDYNSFYEDGLPEWLSPDLISFTWLCPCRRHNVKMIFNCILLCPRTSREQLFHHFTLFWVHTLMIFIEFRFSSVWHLEEFEFDRATFWVI